MPVVERRGEPVNSPPLFANRSHSSPTVFEHRCEQGLVLFVTDGADLEMLADQPQCFGNFFSGQFRFAITGDLHQAVVTPDLDVPRSQ
jgi:hypothetical protein